MSEYVAPYFGRREFISGFTGSAGTAILTKREAVLFTDGRYHNQAEMELPQDWVLMKQGLSGVPTLIEYLANSLEEGAVVGIDPLVHAAEAFKKLETALKAKKINLKPFPNTNGEESGLQSLRCSFVSLDTTKAFQIFIIFRASNRYGMETGRL